MTRLRILIADDNDGVRRALALFLRNCAGVELVGQASDGMEAVQKCAQLHPHVVLMDMTMPRMSGITATSLIRQADACVRVVGLTSIGNTDREQLDALLAAGATDFLFKSATGAEIERAIFAAYDAADCSVA